MFLLFRDCSTTKYLTNETSLFFFLDTQWIRLFKSASRCPCLTAEAGLPSDWDRLSLGERPLNGFKDQLCSLVFMALTDLNTQLQLVGIRTLTVLGAQPGTLKEKRLGVLVLSL